MSRQEKLQAAGAKPQAYPGSEAAGRAMSSACAKSARRRAFLWRLSGTRDALRPRTFFALLYIIWADNLLQCNSFVACNMN